ncbi:hypothetical protein ACNKHL_24455 [Shigella flexneri]
MTFTGDAGKGARAFTADAETPAVTASRLVWSVKAQAMQHLLSEIALVAQWEPQY